MGKFALRELLNKLLWDPREDPGEYEIVYESRGAPGGVVRISAARVTKVFSRGFEHETERGILYIPFHRVIEVRKVRTGELAYVRRR